MMELVEKRESNEEEEKKLLIGGCMDGTIVIFDWENDKNNGAIVFSLQVLFFVENYFCIFDLTDLNQYRKYVLTKNSK